MADQTDIRDQARALRDFFASRDATDLRRTALAVSGLFHRELAPDTDWTGAEYDFNRLFVGPMAVPAPPYASAYQVEPALMGGPTLDVREAYRALGLRVPDQGRTPDDHLAFELDLAAALPGPGEGAADDPVPAEVREWLMGEHLPGWVPAFIGAVEAQPDVSAPVRMAVAALGGWLESIRPPAGAGQA
ncbi:cytoplasmic chaperone TorD family protein [Pseudodesulfovibrio mercurii]|uniref:Cytoplasmic chaperone TorD family protein n=1 Tax=Pseudodesulfovibrio mercurii TaxID=641491 RepID=F0JK52_9BACT|nr:molecular chaperone TorD family protein [Pseudodesulfovibrio mercurii]EGB16301.1 cytoplasmic chaperone TorD family protein [Pseudodesulfovibrio mercurii]